MSRKDSETIRRVRRPRIPLMSRGRVERAPRFRGTGISTGIGVRTIGG